MRKLLILAIAAAPLAMTAPAFASDDDARCPEISQDDWLGLGEIEGRLKALGYQVREIERERNCYQFEGVDANGAEVEGYLDPRTGELVKPQQRARQQDRERDDDGRGGQGQGNRG